jgi:hypothetical protein
MSRHFIRSSDAWDLEEHENDLRVLGYREVTKDKLQPGEFRKLAEEDPDEHRPVLTLEWEDGAIE